MTSFFRLPAIAVGAALLLAAPPRPSTADTKVSMDTKVSTDTKVLPGYWESTTHYTLLLSETSTSRKCLTTDEVDEWLTKPAPRHFTCTYQDKRVGGGRAHFDMSCVDKRGHKLKLAINGVYSPERFHLTANGSLTMVGVPLPGSAEIDAHRLSAECPASVPAGQ